MVWYGMYCCLTISLNNQLTNQPTSQLTKSSKQITHSLSSNCHHKNLPSSSPTSTLRSLGEEKENPLLPTPYDRETVSLFLLKQANSTLVPSLNLFNTPLNEPNSSCNLILAALSVLPSSTW